MSAYNDLPRYHASIKGAIDALHCDLAWYGLDEGDEASQQVLAEAMAVYIQTLRDRIGPLNVVHL